MTHVPIRNWEGARGAAAEGTFGAECPICFEPATHPHATPCGHVFCGPCAQQWALRTNTCPLCRADGAFYPPAPQTIIQEHHTHRTYEFPSGRILEEWDDVSFVRIANDGPDTHARQTSYAVSALETREMTA